MTEFRLGPWNLLAPGVHVLVAQPANVNITLVVGEEAALLVDTGSSPSQGRELVRRVGEVTHRPLTHVVITHAHWDHAYGLAGLGEVTSIAHESVVALLAGERASARPQTDGLGFDVADLAIPTTPISMVTAVDLGGRRVEIVHPDRGHTDGDLIVLVPDAQIACAGDLIEQGDAPAFDDSFPHRWAKALDGLIGSTSDAWSIIPGHGDPVSRQFCILQREQIAAMAEQIAELYDRGTPVAQVYESGAEWAFPDDRVSTAAEALYARLRDEQGPPRPKLPLV